MRRIVRLASLVICLPVIVSACAPPSSGDRGQSAAPGAPSAPRSIAVINSGIPTGLDNRFVVTSNNAARIVLGLYEGSLISSDNQNNRMARLAEAIPSLDNGLWKLNADNTMETRVTIRPGTLWHDGTLLTTKDFLFNDEVYMDRTLPQTIISARTFVEKIEAVDERTLIVKWNQPYILADIYSPNMMPAHILEPSFRQDHQNVTSHPWLTTEYVGTGPFKVKEFVPGTHVDLSAFDGYVLGRPKIDQIQVKFIVDGGTMLANMLSGAGDLATGTGPNVAQAQELKSQNWDGQIGANIGSTYVHLFVQYIEAFPGLITDKRFHKGLMYALDRQELVDTIQNGYGGIAEIPWPTTDPNYPDYLRAVEKYPYDPQRAAAMFQSLGYAKGPDGYLRNTSTGQRLEPIEFRTTAEQPFQVRMLAAMSDYFKSAGLDINQVPIPQERTSDRVYRVTNPGMEELQFGYGPSTLIGFMHSSKLPTAENRYTTGNYPRYASAPWDALIDKYAVTIPMNERKQILTQIFQHLNEELPDMSIIYGVSVQFASKRLNVPEVNPIWSAETWDLK